MEMWIVFLSTNVGKRGKGGQRRYPFSSIERKETARNTSTPHQPKTGGLFFFCPQMEEKEEKGDTVAILSRQ